MAHVIFVSAQVLLVLTLGFWTRTSDLGLTIKLRLMPYKVILFLAPTGAQGEAMSCVRACVRDIPQKNIENEF